MIKLLRNKGYRKILLIRPISPLIDRVGHPRNIRVPFTLKYIEALLKAEGKYNTKLIDCMIDLSPLDELIKVSLDWSPDVVAIDPTTLEYELTLSYSKAIKEEGDIVIVVIGQDASAEPERYIFRDSPIDFVLVGESELSFISLINELNNSKNFMNVKGIYSLGYQDPSLNIVENLDDLPFPIYDSDEFDKYTFFYPVKMNKKVIWGHVLSSRGCPYDCIFCSQTIRRSYGKKVRLRNPINVVDEIEYLKRKGANVIAFEDDNFTTSREQVEGICHEIRRRRLKIKWSAHARVDDVTLPLLKTMKEVGCIQLRFGIESGSNRIIKILRKANHDIDWPERARTVFKAARGIGLPTTALFLIGNPTETKDDIEESIKLAMRLKPDIMHICFFTPYPGSPAFRQFKDRISHEDILKMYHYQRCPVNLSRLSLEELQGIYKKFYRKYLLRISYISGHLIRYGGFYLHNMKTFFRLAQIRKQI